jgi:hypothetical protein
MGGWVDEEVRELGSWGDDGMKGDGVLAFVLLGRKYHFHKWGEGSIMRDCLLPSFD